MTRPQRTFAALLVVVAVLLGLNLMKTSATAATAEGKAGPPTVVKLLLFQTQQYWRVWRDDQRRGCPQRPDLRVVA